VRRAGIAIAALALALGAAACGEETVDAGSAADSIAGFVERETGFVPDDVDCPDDVEADVGERFECDFTGPEGPYVAEVEITEIDGDDARFSIQTNRVE
jgi:hypothetical protein